MQNEPQQIGKGDGKVFGVFHTTVLSGEKGKGVKGESSINSLRPNHTATKGRAAYFPPKDIPRILLSESQQGKCYLGKNFSTN